ncbi:hypothetical protein EYZ11_005541 [Aspergillus tanneri]|uniref:Uncharacterized protein n=1 Tax=Aspergillus tanneri TaxID=1220188 RepID=A0A4S3JK76_9EURO|nr:hypothetical protein EYZ11_005541 [Aspergillus tanneri]
MFEPFSEPFSEVKREVEKIVKEDEEKTRGEGYLLDLILVPVCGDGYLASKLLLSLLQSQHRLRCSTSVSVSET